MSKMRRAVNVILGLVMIACAADLLVDSQDGLLAVALVLGLCLVLYGARMLVYYVTMARHMAGGLSILYLAIMALNMGSFSMVLAHAPQVFSIVYLVGYNALTGIIAIARGLEAKKFESRWKPSIAHGAINLSLALACIVFAGQERVVIGIFCVGLVYRACVRIANALRPTEIVFIR